MCVLQYNSRLLSDNCLSASYTESSESLRSGAALCRLLQSRFPQLQLPSDALITEVVHVVSPVSECCEFIECFILSETFFMCLHFSFYKEKAIHVVLLNASYIFLKHLETIHSFILDVNCSTRAREHYR